MNAQSIFKRKLSAGAEISKPDHVCFRLWAPNAASVKLLFADGQMHALIEESAAGWFSIELKCAIGTHYRYRIINKQGIELLTPDPVSRAQNDSVHSNSIVIDPHAYQWQQPGWKGRPWHETILYEMHVGAYGGFKGAAAKLASLAAMGFTAIELMPIASFPGDRNWGYDGVLQYAPHYAYGTPDDLKALVDEAHMLGLMIFLDVVYNHFGPDGNYLAHYAPAFFSAEHQTLWGDSINFKQPEVRQFLNENVLYWLDEFRFDGLRFDACHAIWDKTWLLEVAQKAGDELGADRAIHLMIENDDNSVSLLQNGFNAQWNDDGHHVLHVLLTGENEGYYSDFGQKPAEKLARCLAEGFIYQGEISEHHDKRSRGEPSAELPTTSFVLFLQNHDQIGNRPFGERLTTLVSTQALRAASALILLSPQIPLLFMGEEFGATQPFLYFTSHEDDKLIVSIREGRRKEFSTFKKFADSEFSLKIPESNHADTFLSSIPRPLSVDDVAPSASLDWSQWTSKLLGVRHHAIIPRLKGARSLRAKAVGPSAVTASWLMGDGSILVITINLGSEHLSLSLSDVISSPQAQVLFDYGDVWQALKKGTLPDNSFIAMLEGPL